VVETIAVVEESPVNEKEPEKSVQTPTPKMEVKHVETRSSMPWWGGIVLGALLVSTIVIIIVIRKNKIN